MNEQRRDERGAIAVRPSVIPPGSVVDNGSGSGDDDDASPALPCPAQTGTNPCHRRHREQGRQLWIFKDNWTAADDDDDDDAKGSVVLHTRARRARPRPLTQRQLPAQLGSYHHPAAAAAAAAAAVAVGSARCHTLGVSE